jgi:hypothetical protein
VPNRLSNTCTPTTYFTMPLPSRSQPSKFAAEFIQRRLLWNIPVFWQ